MLLPDAAVWVSYMTSKKPRAGDAVAIATVSSEPRNHRDVHAVTFCNRGQRFAGSAALDRFGSLVVAQLALAAEFDAGGHSPLPPFAGTLAN